jgi:hypothetical protein
MNEHALKELEPLVGEWATDFDLVYTRVRAPAELQPLAPAESRRRESNPGPPAYKAGALTS